MYILDFDLRLGLLYSRQGAAIDGEKRKECTRLVRSDGLNLKHGSWVRPNRLFPDPIDEHLGELTLDALMEISGVL